MFLKIGIACSVRLFGRFNPSANSPACSSLKYSSGAIQTLMIYSGVFLATSSMLTPPSVETIKTSLFLLLSKVIAA